VRTLRIVSAEAEGEALALAAEALDAGQLIIYPTDTLYALGCRADAGEAVRRVRDAKGREAGKALPLVAADLEQVGALCRSMSPEARRLAAAYWPGPLTLVLEAGLGVAEEVTAGAAGVAVRVPAHPLLLRLCARVGPLVSTSANRSGSAPPRTCEEAVAQVGFAAAIALDGGPGGDRPSTIVDLTGGAPRLLRAGAVAWDAIRATLRGGPA
jgi:L-threonylcarbamoyladenylate synthase